MNVTPIAAELLARGGDWGPGGWWPIFPLFWLVVVGLLIFMVFRVRRGRGPWNAARSGEGVLAERYAKGEISEDEYRDRLRVLKEHS